MDNLQIVSFLPLVSIRMKPSKSESDGDDGRLVVVVVSGVGRARFILSSFYSSIPCQMTNWAISVEMLRLRQSGVQVDARCVVRLSRAKADYTVSSVADAWMPCRVGVRCSMAQMVAVVVVEQRVVVLMAAVGGFRGGDDDVTTVEEGGWRSGCQVAGM
ncbi:hypothetical protein Tco_0680008 [Tanacetum coccineum]|uniref:Uncharacterized protein n=1 Tax=Tanacetum coccineum TaxID=301880 RepID=A0ABQ4XJM8_9ASTR